MLALWIIALHMFGDFVTQTHNMAQYKFSCWKWRTFHVIIYTVPFIPLAFLLGGTWEPWILILLIFIPHWILDSRRWVQSDWAPKPVLVDQSLHILCLALAFTICYSNYFLPSN